MYRFVTALFVLLASIVGAHAQNLPVPSYWKNQRGSEMKLYNIDGRGWFNGVYINHAVGFRCQDSPYDLKGRAIGPGVTFTVVWTNWKENCKSTTVWRGIVAGNTIKTWWVLTRRGGGVILRGTDTFQRY